MKSPYYSNAVQANLFAGVPIAINQPTLWLSLHSEDPSGQDAQSMHEVLGLPRAAVPRGISSWLKTGTYWANVLPVDFAMAQREDTAKFWTLGLAQSGGLWVIGGKLSDNITLTPGTLVSIPALALTSEEI